MHRLEKAFEIDVPVRTAYDQWTQFEEFPKFMEDVEEVRQLDDTHQHWRAKIGGKTKEWDAELYEQVPDQVIAWRSISGPANGGRVRFEPLGPDRTRLYLAMEYEPETTVEKVGDWLGVFSRKVDKTVEDFKQYIERRGHETGAWRGEVHAGDVQPPAGTGKPGRLP
ncbi:MAG: SRPBCC family protein [Betaproteobacteria bacterium]